jgi:hypothetical protein
MTGLDMNNSLFNNPFGGSHQVNTQTGQGSTTTSSTAGASTVASSASGATFVMSQELAALLQAFSSNSGIVLPRDPHLPPGNGMAQVSTAEWLQLGIAAKLALVMSEIAKLNIDQNPMMTALTIRIMEATQKMASAMKKLQEEMTKAQVDSLEADAAKAWAAMGTAIASAVTTIVVTFATAYLSRRDEVEARGRGEALGLDKNTTERMGMEAAIRTNKYGETIGQVIEKGLNATERGISATQDTNKAESAAVQGTAQGAKEYLEKALSALQKTLQDIADALKSDQEKLNSIFSFLKEIQQLETQITRQA